MVLRQHPSSTTSSTCCCHHRTQLKPALAALRAASSSSLSCPSISNKFVEREIPLDGSSFFSSSASFFLLSSRASSLILSSRASSLFLSSNSASNVRAALLSASPLEFTYCEGNLDTEDPTDSSSTYSPK